MAARMCKHPDDDGAMQHAHDRMINPITRSEWEDAPVRKEAVGYALDAVKAHGETVEVSIIDDTGFLKQGKRSRRAAAVHGLGGQDGQLPGGREPDGRESLDARAGGYGAVPAAGSDRRPTALPRGEDPR
jgi:hypothetical protein